MKTLAIIVPAYNEGHRLGSFLKRLDSAIDALNQYDVEVVLVDDGSENPQRKEIPVDFKHKLTILERPNNDGQGAALNDGINFARREFNADFYVTIDGDGQHDPWQIASMLHCLLSQEVDIVFGNRFARADLQMHWKRYSILKGAILFERILTGLDLHDAHNGFRVFTWKCASCIELKQKRMAHATEFKQIVAANSLKYAEHPVSIQYNLDKRGQTDMGSFRILFDLLKAAL